MKLKELIERLQTVQAMNLEPDIEVMVTADNDGESITGLLSNVTVEQSHGDDEAFFIRLFAAEE